MKVLESLVSDNEILKADNEELHTLLTESREDLQAMQSQVEERIVMAPPIRGSLCSENSAHINLLHVNSGYAFKAVTGGKWPVIVHPRFGMSIHTHLSFYLITIDSAVELCQTFIEYRTKGSSYHCECISLHKYSQVLMSSTRSRSLPRPVSVRFLQQNRWFPQKRSTLVSVMRNHNTRLLISASMRTSTISIIPTQYGQTAG
jgi:hypothetical protein